MTSKKRISDLGLVGQRILRQAVSGERTIENSLAADRLAIDRRPRKPNFRGTARSSSASVDHNR